MKNNTVKNINPFMVNQVIKVFTKKSSNPLLLSGKLLSNEIDSHPGTGSIDIPYIVEYDKKTFLYTSPEVRKICLRLSEVSLKLLRYFEYIIPYNQDYVYLNIDKFMDEAGIKSRTTVYKGIQELCETGFITKHIKQSTYWINPFRFFNGKRTAVYPDNISVVE